MRVNTTLRKLREARACKDRYNYLAAKLSGVPDPENNDEYLDFGHPDDEKITLQQIYDICGIDDALWLVFSRAVSRKTNKYAGMLGCIYCAPILHRMNDQRSLDGIAARMRYCVGEITDAKLKIASHNAGSIQPTGNDIAQNAIWAAEGATRGVSSTAVWAAECAACDAGDAAAGIAENIWNEINNEQETLFVKWFGLKQ